MIRHLVMYSGGAGSWAAAKRVAEEHGTEGMALLFADTLIEDPDLYRFLEEGAENVGAPLIRIAEGRTPLEVMRDEKIIGNSRIDPCSKILKRQFLRKWCEDNLDPNEVTIYVGIDWSESHRLGPIQERSKPWRYEAPMCERPLLTKPQVIEWLRAEGIEPPRLYGEGFPHNNCFGRCIKAGQAQWALLLRTHPEQYREWEEWEEEMRASSEKLSKHAILRSKAGGVTTPIPLREFRERIEAQQTFDTTEWGGCGCAL